MAATYGETFIITRLGSVLRLNSVSGLVTDPRGKVVNGLEFSFYSDGKLVSKTVPPPSSLARTLLGVDLRQELRPFRQTRQVDKRPVSFQRAFEVTGLVEAAH